MKEIVNQVVGQTATVVMMAFRDTETGLLPATMQNLWETQRQRNEGLVLGKPWFNWDMPDRFVKLLNFQLKMTNILEIRAYEINDEDRIPVIKNWLGQEVLLLMETFMQEEKDKCKVMKGLFSVLSNRFRLHHICIIIVITIPKKQKQ